MVETLDKKFADNLSEETSTTFTKVAAPDNLRRPILVRPKVLMGTDPTNVNQRVTEALSKPLMGLYHEELHQIMDEIKDGLKYLFQTRNPVTFCASGSNISGLETVLSNLIEEGDAVLVGVVGSCGQRAVEIAKRYGAKVQVLEAKLGTTLQYEQIRAHIQTYKPKIFFIAHGDSSTGVLQRIDNIGDLCRRNNCLLVVNAVNTLGAVEFLADEWKVDAAFSGSQKALGGPAGLAPVTLGPRALAKIANRKTPVKVYYFDVNLLSQWWKCTDKPRWVHHTISAPVLYGFREALADIVDQGVTIFRDRHVDNAQRLYEGLQNIGLELFVEKPQDRLPTITSVRIPHGVKWENVSNYLLQRYSLEVAGGYEQLNGTIFRIGLMNSNATHQKVDFVLRALYDALLVTSKYIAPTSKVYY